MKRKASVFILLFVLTLPGKGSEAGIIIDVEDPRYFHSQQKVIFPGAEVKLVTFEFETVGEGMEAEAKQRAKELHDQFLSKIHDLHGGAIITYVTPKGERIENFRVEAEAVARQQKAQMALWGRIFLDRSNVPLVNTRLMLITLPPGVSATYQRQTLSAGGPPVNVRGVIDAPVTQTRVDFNTVEQDVRPIAWFLSGLARYYKGAVREGTQAKRWLRSSIEDFSAYVEQVPEDLDPSALAQAHLYLARAHIRLAEADPSRESGLLSKAEVHASEAARLNPYDSGVPTVRAVLAARQNADPESVRAYLTEAVRMAPADTNARINLAVMDGAQGNVDEALQQLDKASFVQKIQGKEPLPEVSTLREQLEEYKKYR